ncbi:MAG: S8 family serine peptidase [Fibrobacteria bacterium]|nr:S8 family serine peptidase [Fibrobacteria bacterium]
MSNVLSRIHGTFALGIALVMGLGSTAAAIRPHSEGDQGAKARHQGVRAHGNAQDPWARGFRQQVRPENFTREIGDSWVGLRVPMAQADLGAWIGERLNQSLRQRGTYLQVDRVAKDDLGWSHVRLQQMSAGMPLIGSQILVHVDPSGVVRSVGGRLHSKLKLSNKQVLGAKEAGSRGLGQLLDPSASKVLGSPRLVILDGLVSWEVQLADEAGKPEFLVYLDAQTGAVIHERGLKVHAVPDPAGNSATVTGDLLAGEGGASVQIQGWSNLDGTHFLHSSPAKWGVYDEDAAAWSQKASASWGSSDPAAVSLANNMQAVQEYTSTVLGRNSWNDVGSLLQATVHVGTSYVNAYWDGSTLNFGDGNGVDAAPLTVLDVVAHEFGHAITQSTSDLVYSYESGALNESYSDIMGVLVEFHSQPDGRIAYPGRTASAGDWLMGEDCWLSDVALRDLRDPQRYGQPSYYLGTNWYTGSSDNGGVHTNSGVQNHAFYLLSEGGSGTNDGHPYAVTALGIEAAGRVAMYANMYLLTSGSNYQDSRDAWIQAASVLGIATEPVEQAWAAVGVLPQVAVPVLGPEILEGGTIARGLSKAFSFTLFNQGTGVLQVDSIKITGIHGTYSGLQSFTLAGNQNRDLVVLWDATTDGAFEETIRVWADHAQDPAAQALLRVRVGDPASLVVTPLSIQRSMLVGETAQDQLTLRNEGVADLQWTLSEEFPTSLVAPVVYSAAHHRLREKGELSLAGKPVQGLRGGPDAAGYRWMDSNDPAGPRPAWSSIAATGNLLSTVSNCDDCYESVTFPFPFHGSTWPSVYVSSNGYVTVGAGASTYSNVPLPSTSAPASMIAPYWDDLYPGSQGNVYAEVRSDRLIVEWNNVRLYGGSESVTMQAHLFRNGRIEFQYLSVPTTSSYTVGIQDPTRAIGFSVAYNAIYLGANMAIAIQKGSSWLSVPTTSGTLAGGEETTVAVEFDAANLTSGLYSTTLKVEPADGSGASVRVPVSIDVQGCSTLQLVQSELTFPSTWVGSAVTASVQLTNNCSDAGSVVTLSGLPGTVTHTGTLPLEVAPGATEDLVLQFAPTTVGALDVTVELGLADQDGTVLPLHLTGLATLPPQASLDPTSMLFQVEAHSAPVDQVAVLSNLGGSELTWSVESIQSTDVRAITQQWLPAIRRDLMKSAATLAHPSVPGRAIVGLKPGAAALSSSALNSLGIQSVKELAIARRPGEKSLAFKGRSLVLVSWNPNDVTQESMLAALEADPSVDYAEPDYLIQVERIPNDPSFSSLYGMHNSGQTGGLVDADIDAPEAWEETTGSESVVVGVIDTGIDPLHPDLVDNLWTNPGEIAGNGIDDDGNGYIDDIHGWDFAYDDNDPTDGHGHGTHCAGTIAGRGNNGVGVAGVMWQARVMALKFLTDAGSGSTSDAIDAVSYATAMNVPVTSNSWGGGGFSQGLLDVISVGGLFVAAAGNNGSDNDSYPFYPSSYLADNVLSVAATGSTDALASFSNWGLTSVDLAAPGVSIYSAAPGGGYQYMSGTSMATPHVSGAAGLVLAKNSSLSPVELKQILMSSVDPISSVASRVVSGGRLNVANALRATNGGIVTVSPRGPGSILPGSSQELTVTVDPSSLDAGTYHANVVIRSNDPNLPAISLPITIDATGNACTGLTATPASLDFGSVSLGQQAELEVVLQNSCAEAVTLALAQPLAAPYALVAPLPTNIPAGGEATIAIQFQPSEVGAFNGLLAISSASAIGGLLEVAMQGSAVGVPGIEVSPASLSFEAVAGESDAGALHIANPGTGPLTWQLEGARTTEPPTPTTWLQASTLSGVLQPGEAVDVDITASAALLAAGTYDLDLTVRHDASGDAIVVPVQFLVHPAVVHFQLTASAGVGGTISPSGEVSVVAGSNQTFVMTPDLGYRVSAVLVDGISVGAPSSYTLSNVQANHTVVAQFAPNPPTELCEVKGIPTATGWVVRNAWNDAANGSGVRAAPDAMEIIHRQWGKTDLWVIGNADRFSLVAGKEYTLSFEIRNSAAGAFQGLSWGWATGLNWDSPILQGTAATVSGSFPSSGYRTVEIPFTAAATGSFALALRLAWTSQPGAEFHGFVKNIKVCEPSTTPSYTITASAGVGGTITPSGEITVIEGGSASFEVAASSGYTILDVTVDGVSQGAVSTVSLTNIVANHTVSATFRAIPSYTITASAGVGGTITPSGEITVIEGAALRSRSRPPRGTPSWM